MQGRVTKKIHVANIYNQTPIYLENVKTWVNAENAQVGKDQIKKVGRSARSITRKRIDSSHWFGQFIGDRFTEEYRQFKKTHGWSAYDYGYGGYDRPTLPPRKKVAAPKVTSGPASPPPIRKIVGGRTKFIPSGMHDDDDDDVDEILTSDSDSDDAKPKVAEISATFKPYDGGAKRLSTGDGLLSSLPTDLKNKTVFTGMRDSPSRPRKAIDSDADSDDDDLPSKRANDVSADDGEAKPDTLAFTNDAISLEQVSSCRWCHSFGCL